MAVTRGEKVLCKCKNCRDPFYARKADRLRGWGKFCSKSCKAKWQEKRTHQYAAYKERTADRFDFPEGAGNP